MPVKTNNIHNEQETIVTLRYSTCYIELLYEYMYELNTICLLCLCVGMQVSIIEFINIMEMYLCIYFIILLNIWTLQQIIFIECLSGSNLINIRYL